MGITHRSIFLERGDLNKGIRPAITNQQLNHKNLAQTFNSLFFRKIMDPPANEALSLIQKESDKQLDKLLLKDGRLISYKDKQGMTLLHRAAQSGSYNCSQVSG